MMKKVAHESVLRHKTLPALISVAVGLALPAAAQAQLMLEEVVVTAQKRAESLQDVSVSVVALGGERLEDMDITDLADLEAYVPNFSKSETAAGNILIIRGIGSGVNQGFEQSVMQYVDDIAYGRAPLGRLPFMDLERLEVLRGPQNVLFGKNSIAGALSYSTAKPTDELSGRLSLGYEAEYGDIEATAAVSGPLSDTFRARLAARSSQQGGYYENTFNGDDEEDRLENAIRLALAWDVSDSVSVDLKLQRDEIESKGQAQEVVFGYGSLTPGLEGQTFPQVVEFFGGVAPGGPQDVGSTDISLDRKRESNIDESNDLTVNNFQFTVNWEADNFTFTSVSGWINYDQDQVCDCDATGVDVFTSKSVEEYEQFSQELRFTSPGGETVDWIAGAFYQSWDLDFVQNVMVDDENILTALDTFQPGLGQVANAFSTRDFQADSDTYAVFAQATWNVKDTVRLILGGRYTYEEKSASRSLDLIDSSTGAFNLGQAIFSEAAFASDYDSLGLAQPGTYSRHNVADDRTEEAFTPTAIVEWDVSGDHMLYFSASSGFKSGGFDALANRSKDFEFEEEDVIAYELGAKSSLLGGAAELNVALFHQVYSDLQQSAFDGTAAFIVGNVGEATSQGVELDGRWLLTEGLTLAGSFTYLDFVYDEWDGAPCNSREAQLTGVSSCDRSGTTSGQTPEYAASINLDYTTTISEGLSLRSTLGLNYEGEHDTEPTQDENLFQDGYTLVDLRLALEAESWTLALLGKNLTDEEVIAFSNEVPLSRLLTQAPTYVAYLKRPRTVALQFDYRF